MRLPDEFVHQYCEAPDPVKYAASIARAKRTLRLLYDLQFLGQENVPQTGPGIVAFVHRSYKDPWILGCAIPRYIAGYAKKELLSWYYFGLGTKYFTNRGFSFVDRKNAAKSELEPVYENMRAGRLSAIALEGTSKNRGKRVGKPMPGIGRIALMMANEGIECSITPVAIGSEKVRWDEAMVAVVGSPFTARGMDVSTIKQRKDAAKEVTAEVYDRLQELNDQVWELREADWLKSRTGPFDRLPSDSH